MPHYISSGKYSLLLACVLSAIVFGLLTSLPYTFAADADDAAVTFRSPYDPDPTHAWNKLHVALFIREKAGVAVTHRFDPLTESVDWQKILEKLKADTSTQVGIMMLAQKGAVDDRYFLFAADSHKVALTTLTAFLTDNSDRLIDAPVKRVMLQRDLWALFDSLAWMPDEWVHNSADERAAMQLRGLLAQLISRLALTPEQIKALPDNYQVAVKADAFPAKADAENPAQAYLPVDLFTEDGPWVRMSDFPPLARFHTREVRARAHFNVLIRLPGGRAETVAYLQSLSGKDEESMPQFPVGTQFALVRRALAIGTDHRIHLTPLIESVQIRVYRRFSMPVEAGISDQDFYALHLNRAALYRGGHGLVAELPPQFPGNEGLNIVPLTKPSAAIVQKPIPLQNPNCFACHSQPGIHSVNSILNLTRYEHQTFDYYPIRADIESSYTSKHKYASFEWGLLRGYLDTIAAQEK